jgi:hypothetical protein
MISGAAFATGSGTLGWMTGPAIDGADRPDMTPKAKSPDLTVEEKSEVIATLQ